MIISWNKLKTAEGSAKQVPEIVACLVAGGDVSKYTLELESLFINQGEIYTATAPALDLLFSQLPSAKFPEAVLHTIGNLAGADLLRAWVVAPPAIRPEIQNLFEKHQAQLLTMFESGKPEVRSAAAFVLGATPESLSDIVRSRLIQQLKIEMDYSVIASCLLALSRLTTVDEFKKLSSEFSKAESPLVRGAWGMGCLRSGDSITNSNIAAAIIDWLSIHTDVTKNNFCWITPSIRFSNINTFFERRLHHAIVLSELAKTQNSKLDSWTDFILSVPERTQDGWAYRAASDFLYHVSGLLEFEPRPIMTPDQLTEPQQNLLTRLENSPLCAQAGFGLPATGPVRSRWLGHAPASVMERMVSVEEDLHGKPGKVPAYWILSRRILGKPGVPEIDALVGFDQWRLLVAQAFGEYNHTWLPPDLNEINNCMELAINDDRMKDSLVPLVDECAARVAEFQRQHLNPKYWAISILLIVRPLKHLHITWRANWESLITFEGEPDFWIREIVEWLPVEVRERWLWDNLQRMRYEVHYIDLLPSTRLIKRTLQAINKIRLSGKEMMASTNQLEKMIYDLASSNSLFAESIKETKN